MKAIKLHMNGIILSLFEIAVGVLLLINPIGFTTGIIMAAGAVLSVVGIISGIKYFRAEITEAVAGQYLTKGLVALLAGIFCLTRAQWFIEIFPALTIVYGIAVLVAGLGKVQLTVDMLRRRNNKWFLALISTAISLACAAIILKNPFASTTVLWMFIGITLIGQAILDIATLIVSSITKKGDDTADGEEKTEQTEAAEAAE